MNDTITIKRKKIEKSTAEVYSDNLETWMAYWRSNPHRFITEYLGLKLYPFQKFLIWVMNFFPNFIFVASRGLAKSTLTLLFAIQRAILYPGEQIIVVCPVRTQAGTFIQKINELKEESGQLDDEIFKVLTSDQKSRILFRNGSRIFSVPYGESALGTRGNILIVDEFVRAQKEVITRVYIPMLSDPRTPDYNELSEDEKAALPLEDMHEVYLSSIRGADEWSYKKFEQYINHMMRGSSEYMAVSLPYHFGVKHRFIHPVKVKQQFRDSPEAPELLKAVRYAANI